jgi:hypothetical protein
MDSLLEDIDAFDTQSFGSFEFRRSSLEAVRDALDMLDLMDPSRDNMYVYIHTYIHTYVHTCIYTDIHTYIHKYIHTHRHICIHTCAYECATVQFTHVLLSGDHFHIMYLGL